MRRFRYGLGVHYRWGDKDQFSHGKFLFIVMGNQTNMGLIGGFGVHGGTFQNLCYMLPWPLFYIPIVRDVLMWTGAISSKTDLLDILNKGRSVCYAPQGMQKGNDMEQGDMFPDLGVFEFAMEHNIKVVPVRISDEDKRYYILNGPVSIQDWSMQKMGWPWPFCIIPRWKGSPIVVEVGVPLKSNLQTNAEEFRALFMSQMKRYI